MSTQLRHVVNEDALGESRFCSTQSVALSDV